MKIRWMIALMLALTLMVFWISGTAMANGGPHGGYGATTDACAGCHRAHTATGAQLLIAATPYALCITCHGSVAGGAQTNVVDGVYAQYRNAGTYTNKTVVGTEGTPGNPLNAGGFGFYRVQGQAAFTAVTSIHSADSTTAASWGNGVNRGVTAALTAGNLSCASCHDPHGSTNYRIIKTTVNGVATTVTQVDEAAKNYTTEAWPTDLSNVCQACHGAYHRDAAGQGSTVDAGTYTHRVDMAYNAAPYTGNVNPETTALSGYTLPLAGTTVVCSTCHLSHGSSSAMGGWANSTGLPGNTSATDSALLRLDNRGVCEVCHRK